MIICWDNLEKFNIRLTNRGNLRGDDGTYYYYDSCLVCGEPFLSKGKQDIQYCSRECMVKDPNYKKAVGKFKSNLDIKTEILTSEDIIKLREKFPRTFTRIIKNEYPNTKIEIENFCVNIIPQINNFSQKIFHYCNKLLDYPICEVCGKKITKFDALNKTYGYKNVCSAGCSQKTSQIREKKKLVKRLSKNDIYQNLVVTVSLSRTDIYYKIKDIFTKTDIPNLERYIYVHDSNLLSNIYKIELGSSFLEKIYLILNNIVEEPLCPICEKNKLKFINISNGYTNTCSNSKCQKTYRNSINEKNYKFNKLTRNEIKTFLQQELKSIKKLTKNEIVLIKRFRNLYENIIVETQYLSEDTKFSERIFHILNDLYEVPYCKICGKIIDQKFLTLEINYSDMCIECNRKAAGKLISKKLSKNLRSKNYDFYKKYLDKEEEYTLISTKEEFLIDGELKILHNKCGNVYTRRNAYLNGCPLCFTKHKAQNEVSRWLKDYIDIEIDKRKYLDNKFEIDIFIPSFKIGIEYDDISTHSEIKGGKDKFYHVNKTDLCINKGIYLLHILSSEWFSKRKIMKSALLSKLGIFENRIYARKCEIRSLTFEESNIFLLKNHLQGYCNSSIRYGLFYNDELVSCMTFGKRKITGKIELELLRFCNKLNTQIIGGASKLFKHFVRNNEFEEIVSYADRRWSNGNLYEQLGFEFSHKSAPSYWYLVNGKLVHRSIYMKHKLPNLLKDFDPNLTEWENMQMNGFDRIWDCGCLVYKFKKE